MRIDTKRNGWQLASIMLMMGVIFMDVDNVMGQSAEWDAPKSADNLKNPCDGQEASLQAGKKLYTQYCAVCHGDKGKGDGVAGLSLKPKPANFTNAKMMQQHTDGALFWKLTNGRPPMAAYKSILTEEQRWQLVSFLRTFEK